jgi:hypothetical protein
MPFRSSKGWTADTKIGGPAQHYVNGLQYFSGRASVVHRSISRTVRRFLRALGQPCFMVRFT